MPPKKKTEVVEEVVEVVEEAPAAKEVDPSVVRMDVSRMFASRATFDTSGLAGPANDDYRRAYAAWDDEITEEDEHLTYIKESPEGLDRIRKDAYRP